MQRDLREAMQVEVCPAIEPGDAALDHVKADVRLFGDREDLGCHEPRQEKSDLGKRGHVMAAKSAGVAAGDWCSSQRRKREGGADDSHVQPPKIFVGEHGCISFLFDLLGLFVEIRRDRQSVEKLGFLPERSLDMSPSHSAEITILVIALQAVLFTAISVLLGQNSQGIGGEDTDDRLRVGSLGSHCTSLRPLDGVSNENKRETTLDMAPLWRHVGSHDT